MASLGAEISARLAGWHIFSEAEAEKGTKPALRRGSCFDRTSDSPQNPEQNPSITTPAVDNGPEDSKTSPAKADCATCAKSYHTNALVELTCKHHYCKTCFSKLVKESLSTPSAFPPLCCKIAVPFLAVAENVDPFLFLGYRTKQKEIADAGPLYCAFANCAVKILEKEINRNMAWCSTCTRTTCTRCRWEYDTRQGKPSHVCKKDKPMATLLSIAKTEGYQACYQCGNVTSLNFGCHHMICRCKAEFCCVCGFPWKNCDCEKYDHPRILERAERAMGIRAARRIARNLDPDPRPRQQQLDELQERLKTDCDHSSFFRREHSRKTPGHCLICEYQGWIYILPCEHCHFTSCRACHNYHGWDGGREFHYKYDFSDMWDELIRSGKAHASHRYLKDRAENSGSGSEE